MNMFILCFQPYAARRLMNWKEVDYVVSIGSGLNKTSTSNHTPGYKLQNVNQPVPSEYLRCSGKISVSPPSTLSSSITQFIPRMAVWSKATQLHVMLCHGPEVMGSNPHRVELGDAESFTLGGTLTKIREL